MEITGAKIDMSRMTMTVRIKGYRRFRVKCAIALCLCRLAARILGTGFERADA